MARLAKTHHRNPQTALSGRNSLRPPSMNLTGPPSDPRDSITNDRRDILVVAIPTTDLRAIVPSIIELHQASQLLRRPIRFAIAEGSNIPRSRNSVLDQLREVHPGQDRLWVLWLDSDIVIAPGSGEAVADAIIWAETKGVAVAANYRMADGQPVLITSRDPQTSRHYTNDELAKIDDFTEIGMTGFGFLYLNQPLHYEFHADTVGEDIHFWLDNLDLTVYVAPRITLGHKKLVIL